MRVCSKCGESKDAGDFYPKMGRCKSCHKTSMVAYHRGHPEQTKAAQAKWVAKPGSRATQVAAAKRWQRENPERVAYAQFLRGLKKYGLTLATYNQMQARQDFRCAICGSDEQDLHIDHSHETMQVRGLLCSNCNTGIGLLRDSSEVLGRAAHYVSA